MVRRRLVHCLAGATVTRSVLEEVAALPSGVTPQLLDEVGSAVLLIDAVEPLMPANA